MQFAISDAAANGETAAIIAASSGYKIVVQQLAMMAAGTATTIVFDTGGTNITPTFANGVRTPMVLPFSKAGWFHGTVGAALDATCSAGSTTAILIGYEYIRVYG